VSWSASPSPPKRKFLVPAPVPEERPRPFKAYERVRWRREPGCEGQIVIPAYGGLPSSARQRPRRVKVFWWRPRNGYEWCYEADLEAIDLVTELGRLL
jgi:hypothetical protein